MLKGAGLIGEGWWLQCLTCYEGSIRSWCYLHLDRLIEILFRLYQTIVEVAERCFEKCWIGTPTKRQVSKRQV